MGTDVLGNKYYEIPPDPSRGKRRASRWFEPVIKENFEQDLPAEWQSWLRGRRETPPTVEEIAENTRIMLMKKENAAKLEAEKKPSKSLEIEAPKKGFDSYPNYGDDYEFHPGEERRNR